MTIKPGQANAPYDIELTDGRKTYGLTLDNTTGNAVAVSAATEDQLAVYTSNVGKRAGDFDEQRTWKGGRGGEFFSDDPTRFFDAENVWSMASGHVTPTMQWKFARGLRNEDMYMPGDVTWISLGTGGSGGDVSTKFTASASYSATHVQLWLRRRGSPQGLWVYLYSDSAGQPGSPLVYAYKLDEGDTANPGINDIVSFLFDGDNVSGTSLTSGTTYHVVLHPDVGDSAANHWEVGVDAATANGFDKTSGSWVATSYSIYFRVTAANTSRRWWHFKYFDVDYLADMKLDGTTVSVLYMSGDRGTASGGSPTTLVDSSKTWVVNRWAGARVANYTYPYEQHTIVSNTTNTLTTDAWTNNPTAGDNYVIYDTEWWTAIGTTGLGIVLSQPLVSNSVVYFPQGGSDNIRRMRYNTSTGAHEFADDGTNKANLLIRGYRGSDNTAVVWRGDTTSVSVSRANVVNWGSNLSFGSAINIGSNTNGILALGLDVDSNLRIFKADGTWYLNSSEQAVSINYGLQNTPSSTNGVASVAHNKFYYFNWLWSLEREYGLPGSTTNTLDDIGWGWKDAAFPGRDGTISSLCPVVGWLFATVDAGATGTSSVVCWDGTGWHEVLRAPIYGSRGWMCFYQPGEPKRSRLWSNFGDDVLYQKLPLNKARPIDDSGVDYQHEGVLYSGTIDMGTAAKLPKFIRQLTLNSKNLDGGTRVEVDYQVDNDIGEAGYENWISAGRIVASPEQSVAIDASNIRQFRYRLRMMTDDADVPPDVKGVVPTGFARSQFRRVFTLRLQTGKITTPQATRAVPSDELIAWLNSAAGFPGKVVMTSTYESLHNFVVVLAPVTLYPNNPKITGRPEEATFMLSLMEI